MAHQMSPPQRPGFGASPYYQQPAHSPPGIALPPAKRPRLSPDAGSPHTQNAAFPGSPYSSYASTPVGTAGSPPPFNAPQPHAASPTVGSMGPPPKPTAEQKAAKEKEEKEKVTDISDISDAMWGSGVDLREEENYLSSTSRAIYGSHPYDAQAAASSQNNFSLLTQGLQPGQLNGNGPVSQSATSMENIQRDLDRKHREAALKYAKDNEQHLRNPFLFGNSLRFKMHKISVDQGVRLDVKGLYEPPRQQPPPPHNPHNVNSVVARGPNGEALANIQASNPAVARHAILEEGARYADILTLVSLATNERLRVLVDEAYAISRGRRLGSHGIAPPDFKDIASGEGRRSASVKPESITNTAWDRTPETTSADGTKADTVSFTTSLTNHLSSLAISAHAAEAERIKRRAARAARIKAAAANADLAPLDPGTPSTPAGPATPISASAPTDSPAPIGGDNKPLTKKERERAAKAGQTEEVLHKNANSTAAMQLGFGKKAKRYSWMSGGAAAAPSNPFARPAAVSKPSTPAPAAKTEKAGLGKERRFGAWREDGPAGLGVQMRDLIAVLERDGRAPLTVERAWARLEREAEA